MSWIENDLNCVTGAFARGLKPDPILTITEWADKFRQLPSSNAEPGQWRTDRTPYLKEVMDVFSPQSKARKVVIMKGAQLGYTEALLNISFYYVDYVPSNQMIVYPTKEIAERTSKSRVVKSAEAMPGLREKIGNQKKKDSGDTILQKDYEGGSLFFSGSNSPSTLCSIAVKLVLCDEVDRFAPDCGGEGSPVELAEKRTSTYSMTRKIGLVSTPTHEEESVIAAEFELSDKRYFFVPCPHCGEFQKLEFDNLHYQSKDGRVFGEVKYKCIECGDLIDERFKTRMLRQGEWRATAESDIAGFHMNGLYSPLGWVSWSEIANEDLASQKDTRKRKVFINTRRGEVFSSGGEVPDYEKLYARREAYKESTVPHGVLFLTLAVDVQEDRLEGELVGWGQNGESWSIEYRVFHGDTKELKVWDDLHKYIEGTYTIEGLNTKLPIQLAGIDSGFRTQQVYRFVRRFGGRRVYALKGRDTYDWAVSKPSKVDLVLDDANKTKKRRAIDLYHVGASLIKEELYNNLNLPIPDNDEPFPFGFCHFPEYSQDYFRSLTSEKCVTSVIRGRVKREWVKIFERNEALDVRVYNIALATLYGYFRMTNEELQAMYTKLYIDKSTAPKTQKVKDSKKSYTIKRRKGSFFN